MFGKVALAAVFAVVGVTAVVAQTDPIATRKAAMKGVGAATAAGAKFVKGEAPFNLDEAKKILTTYSEGAKAFGGLFPDTSKTGGETTAAPTIWEKNDDFKAALAKWGKEADDAMASVKDLDTFKAAFGNITKNCASCHETFRIKK